MTNSVSRDLESFQDGFTGLPGGGAVPMGYDSCKDLILQENRLMDYFSGPISSTMVPSGS
jgi:hypothetical protein